MKEGKGGERKDGGEKCGEEKGRGRNGEKGKGLGGNSGEGKSGGGKVREEKVKNDVRVFKSGPTGISLRCVTLFPRHTKAHS